MKLLLKLILIIVPITFFVGCYYDKESELYPNSYCDMTVYTYSGAVSTIIKNNCATSGCHVTGNSPRIDLSTYNGVYANRVVVKDRACVQKNMPSAAPLSNCDMTKLQKWIDAGAPNN